MDEEANRRLMVWAIFYGGLVSMQYHPRNAGNTVDLASLSHVADEMLEFFKARERRETEIWLQSELHQP